MKKMFVDIGVALFILGGAVVVVGLCFLIPTMIADMAAFVREQFGQAAAVGFSLASVGAMLALVGFAIVRLVEDE